MPAPTNQNTTLRSHFFSLKIFAVLALASGAVMGRTVFAQTIASPAASDSASSQAATTLKSTTRRVNVDVVVTDPQGRPVTGLSREDFNVAEDKTPQPLRSFEVHVAAAQVAYIAPRVPPLPPNTFLNILEAPESGTPTVILYDALNTPLTEQEYGHQEIVNFMKHRHPGTQIAVFVLSERLHLLQGFTEDTDLLSAALESKKGSPQSTRLLPPSATPVPAPISDTPPGADQGFENVLLHFASMDALERSMLQDQRIEITLNALAEMGRFLSSMPGRKNLVWLSSGFPASIFPSNNSLDHDQSIRNYSEEIRRATDLLNLSHVAVYPVDVRGARVSPVFSAATNADFYNDPAKVNLAHRSFTIGEGAERATMNSIADNTGGHAFYGTNGLQEAVDQAISNGSTYYSLSYAPTNPNFDGSLRKIKVSLRQAGYTLAYRKTYYADDLSAIAQPAPDAPQGPLTLSLERGTPLSHNLLVEAHLDAEGTPVPATAAQMEMLSHYEAMRPQKKTKTPLAQIQPVMMQEYVISYGLIARQLEMQADSAGTRNASIEFGVLSYDEDGGKLNGIDSRDEDAITPSRYAALANGGYHFVQSVMIPVTAKSVRLAVRDTRSNRIGSLEVQLPLTKTADARMPGFTAP